MRAQTSLERHTVSTSRDSRQPPKRGAKKRGPAAKHKGLGIMKGDVHGYNLRPISKARAAAQSGERKSALDLYVYGTWNADPMQTVELERRGTPVTIVKDLSKKMGIPTVRMFKILGLPKATATKKARGGENVTGTAGYAAMGMAKLLAAAEEIVANSTADEARNFDAAEWLGRWIERPQPALGGRRPAELLDTATGVQVVARLLGSIESGSYQ
jgi:putative toxin-antitoxin system antitoxin component (TIGR02293 family)